jgi:hypothetical protein
VKFKILEAENVTAFGTGETIDISSGGVALTVNNPLPAGCFVELSISWPALLEQGCQIRLVTYGRVVRSTPKRTVCTIDKYEFRTQARTPSSSPRTPADSRLLQWANTYRKETPKSGAAGRV